MASKYRINNNKSYTKLTSLLFCWTFIWPMNSYKHGFDFKTKQENDLQWSEQR